MYSMSRRECVGIYLCLRQDVAKGPLSFSLSVWGKMDNVVVCVCLSVCVCARVRVCVCSLDVG